MGLQGPLGSVGVCRSLLGSAEVCRGLLRSSEVWWGLLESGCDLLGSAELG